jgi:PPM family protein phosphatase
LVAETVKESLLKSESILEAVYEAEKKLSSYKRKNPSTEYMSTTIAVTEILDNGILVSWAGDSRVYQFRDGKIIFMTSDHSWVADAVKKGDLSTVEALFYPRANKLTKSIKDSSNPVKLEQVLIQDIRLNDYFLICSDGITESWIDSDLEELFSSLKSSRIKKKL